MLENISVDKIFLSVDAIDADLGITSYTMDDVNLKIIGMNNAKEVLSSLRISSKFTTHALFTVGLLDKISTIICGKELDDSIAQKFRDAWERKLFLYKQYRLTNRKICQPCFYSFLVNTIYSPL